MPSTEHEPLLLLGGGGHAAVVAESAARCGWTIRGYFDDDAERTLFDLPRLGTIDDVDAWFAHALGHGLLHAAVGENALRIRLLERFGAQRFAPIVDPTALISPSARVARGSFIGPGAVINARATLGECVIINTAAVIEHDCTIGRGAHIAPGAVLGGLVDVGERTLIGLGARVLPKLSIGCDAIIGAGATVIRDVPDNTTVVGSPAGSRVGRE